MGFWTEAALLSRAPASTRWCSGPATSREAHARRRVSRCWPSSSARATSSCACGAEAAQLMEPADVVLRFLESGRTPLRGRVLPLAVPRRAQGAVRRHLPSTPTSRATPPRRSCSTCASSPRSAWCRSWCSACSSPPTRSSTRAHPPQARARRRAGRAAVVRRDPRPGGADHRAARAGTIPIVTFAFTDGQDGEAALRAPRRAAHRAADAQADLPASPGRAAAARRARAARQPDDRLHDALRRRRSCRARSARSRTSRAGWSSSWCRTS